MFKLLPASVLVIFVFLFAVQPELLSRLLPIPASAPDFTEYHDLAYGNDPSIIQIPSTGDAAGRIDPAVDSLFRRTLPTGNLITIKIPKESLDSELFIKIAPQDAALVIRQSPPPGNLYLIEDLAAEISLLPKTFVDIELNKKTYLKNEAELSFIYKSTGKPTLDPGSLKLYVYSLERQQWEIVAKQNLTKTSELVIVTGYVHSFSLYGLMNEKITKESQRTKLESLKQELLNLLKQIKNLF